MNTWLWCVALGYAMIGALQVGLVWHNLKHFRRCADLVAWPKADDHVAVLVPARDEGARISECIADVLKQSWPNLSLHVLDDQSGDDTQAQAIAQAGADARFHLMVNQEPPPANWNGKSWACQLLAQASHGEWLCFVDADTRLNPEAIGRAMAVATEQGAHLLSFWPRQLMLTPGERLMMPLLAFVLLAHLPLRLVTNSSDPRFSAANGQFLLIRRDTYQAIGGHAAIHADLVDDLALARLVKSRGGRVVIHDAGNAVMCRMYTDWRALWAGFRKNLFPAFGGQPGPFVTGVGILGIWHGLPLALVIVGVWGQWALPIVAGVLQMGCGMVIRAMLAARLEQPWGVIVLHPLAVLCLVVLALDSWRGWALGGVEWKGRRYRRGRYQGC
jgi:glycosyltransferase involved in cell wall biosynthesis